jgi:hypothetical protein
MHKPNVISLRNYAMTTNFERYSEQCAADGIIESPEAMAGYAEGFARNLVLKMGITERDAECFRKNAGSAKKMPGFDEYVDALTAACGKAETL